jgi:hypothetical protein
MADDDPSGEASGNRPRRARRYRNAGCERRNAVLRGLSDRVCAAGALPIASQRRIISIRSRQMGNPAFEEHH